MVRFTVFVVSMFLMAAPAFAAEKTELKTQKDKLSYAIGVNMGKNFKASGMEVDADMLAKGLKDIQAGGKPLLTDEEIKAVILATQKDLQGKHAEKNKKEGEAFLKANKEKKGVKTLKSGLQYKVLVEGKGKLPQTTDTVTVHYKGTLIDGTEFDSSYKREEPATFPVQGVISGWTEALQLMKVGSKWQLFIPADLAYGESGRPGIPPNAVLIFEVELLSIEK